MPCRLVAWWIVVGLFAAKMAIKDGGFDKKAIILFNVLQVIGNAVAWIIVAPVLDILVYAEPVNKVFVQGFFAFLGNVIITAGTKPLVIDQSVIYVGKDIKRNTRPVMAGLKRFCPRPPKVIFTTPIENTAPIRTTHHGVDTGRFIARRRPVTTAERSAMVEGLFIIYLVTAHSVRTQAPVLTARTRSSAQP